MGRIDGDFYLNDIWVDNKVRMDSEDCTNKCILQPQFCLALMCNVFVEDV